MKGWFHRSLGVLSGIAVLLGSAAVTHAQEPLAKAKALYAAASYEEALSVLASVNLPEAQQYKALCMLALGRGQDASRAVELLVTSSPSFEPSADEVPPRFVTLVSEAKKRLFPTIAMKAFSEARDQLKNGERDQAMKNFDLVLQLASSPGFKDTSDAEDLRTLASGFIELARVSDAPRSASAPATTAVVSSTASNTPPANVAAPVVNPPVAPVAVPRPAAPVTRPSSTPSPTPTRTAASRAASPPIKADTAPSKVDAAASKVEATPPPTTAASAGEVTQPVALKQTIPPLPPGIAGLGGPTAAVRVVIGVDGKVTSASMQQASHPLYDRLVLQAAREWLYAPATLNGQPVVTEKVVAIQLR